MAVGVEPHSPGRRKRLHDTVLVYHPTEAAAYADLLRQAGYPGPVLAASTPEAGVALAPRAQILFAGRVPAEVLAAARQLRWIQSMWAGVDQWLALPLPEHVQLAHMVGPYGILISEYVFAYLLAHVRQIDRYRQQQEERIWRQHRPGRLHGARLGVAGMGAIGADIARLGRAFGMEVWGLSRTGAPHPAADRMFAVAELVAFAAGVDYLVAVLPNTPATRGLIGADVLAALKPEAVFVNVGRGATVDEAALVAALQAGRLRAAILDVFQTEPLPPDHPFWTLPGCTVTPHVSGPSLREDMVAAFLENVRRQAAGQGLLGLVDRQRGY